MGVRVRRVYDPSGPRDGLRVLVDRLWPRGVPRDAARVDEWPKALTPSTELRRWYHGPEGSYDEFRRRYEAELAAPEATAALDRLRETARTGTVTLVTSVKSTDESHAAVLAHLLES